MFRSPVKSICIYVHWNKLNEIESEDLLAIELLSKNVDQVILVQNIDKGKLFRGIESQLPSNVIHLNRENIGYDFGAYKYGVDWVRKKFQNFDELFLVNNSTIPIVNSFEALFDNLRASDGDLVGLTDSEEKLWHIQSYFLFFKKSILSDQIFDEWWAKANISSIKSETVKHLELPMADFYRKNGYKAEVLWKVADLKRFLMSDIGLAAMNKHKKLPGVKELYEKLETGTAFNPTHALWNVLIELGYPLIKKDLITNRVHASLGQDKWKHYILDLNIRKRINSNN